MTALTPTDRPAGRFFIVGCRKLPPVRIYMATTALRHQLAEYERTLRLIRRLVALVTCHHGMFTLEGKLCFGAMIVGDRPPSLYRVTGRATGLCHHDVERTSVHIGMAGDALCGRVHKPGRLSSFRFVAGQARNGQVCTSQLEISRIMARHGECRR